MFDAKQFCGLQGGGANSFEWMEPGFLQQFEFADKTKPIQVVDKS